MDIPTEQMIELVALVAALLQMLKAVPLIARYTAWLPVASVAMGIVLAFLMKVPEPIVPGIMVGLAASGGYSFMKPKNGKPKDPGP